MAVTELTAVSGRPAVRTVSGRARAVCGFGHGRPGLSVAVSCCVGSRLWLLWPSAEQPKTFWLYKSCRRPSFERPLNGGWNGQAVSKLCPKLLLGPFKKEQPGREENRLSCPPGRCAPVRGQGVASQ